MSDLTKEQLKYSLLLMKEATLHQKPDLPNEAKANIDQAYTQLCKIVEEHFKYKYLDNDPECYHIEDVQPVQFLCDDLILKIVEICEEPELAAWKITKVRELLTRQPQKQVVTKEWIMKRYGEEFKMNVIWSGCIDFVIKLFKELGISITD